MAARSIQVGAQILVGKVAGLVWEEAIKRELPMSEECDWHQARCVGIERRHLSEVDVVDAEQTNDQ